MKVDGVQVPVQRKMLYAERPGPEASVEDAQESAMVEVPVGVARSEPGVVGGVESMVIVVVAVEVPFVLVAVTVKTVVETGFTVTEPMRVDVLESAPLSMRTEDAFVMFQESVEVPAERTKEGEAEKEEMLGKAELCVVPEAMLDDAEMFPTLSCPVTE